MKDASWTDVVDRIGRVDENIADKVISPDCRCDDTGR